MKKIVIFFVLTYLRLLAKIQLSKSHPVIIGVGGSSGKSSLTKLIAIGLESKYKVHYSQGKNSETGIPLDVLGITLKDFSKRTWVYVLFTALVKVLTNWERYDVYIPEMGIDSPIEPKNMSYLLRIVHPHVGVLTNISLEHSQYFDFLTDESDENLREKFLLKKTSEQEMLLLTNLTQQDTAIVNVNDPIISGMRNHIKAKQVTIGTKTGKADYHIKNIKVDLNSFSIRFTYEQKEYSLNVHELLPEHYSYSFVIAIAVGVVLGVSIEQIISSIEKNFSLPPGRSSVFKGIKNTIILDSSYNNATLPPLIDMLSLLHKIGPGRRKVAIIGDMRELGSMTKRSHIKAAWQIMKNADIAILIGPQMKSYAEPVLMDNKYPHFSYNTFNEAKQKILDTIRENDIILIKGSQNTLLLERAVEMLLANPEDVQKLCRRGEYWDREREESP